MHVLELYQQMIRRSERGSGLTLTDPKVTMMCLPSEELDVRGMAAFKIPVKLPKWVRSVQVALHSTLGPCPNLLVALAIEFSRSINARGSGSSATAAMRDRRMVHFSIPAPICTEEQAVASAEAVSNQEEPYRCVLWVKYCR